MDRQMPKIVADLAGFELYVECDGPKCAEPVKLYPSNLRILRLKMRLDTLLARLVCQRCGRKPKHLFVQLLGRGIAGHPDERTPQWILDRKGEWKEVPGTRRSADEPPSSYDLFWTMHKAFKRGKPTPDRRR